MEEEAKIEMEALVLWRIKSHSCFLRLERKLPRSHPSPLLFWSLPPKKKVHLQLILIFPYCITSLICFSNTARVPYCLNLSWQSVIIQSSCAPHHLEVCTSKITTLGGLVTSAAAEKNFLLFFWCATGHALCPWFQREAAAKSLQEMQILVVLILSLLQYKYWGHIGKNRGLILSWISWLKSPRVWCPAVTPAHREDPADLYVVIVVK